MHVALAPFRLNEGISEDDLMTTSDAFEKKFVQHLSCSSWEAW